MQFTNRLFFKMEGRVLVHDSNNVHSLVHGKVGPSRYAIAGDERGFEKRGVA